LTNLQPAIQQLTFFGPLCMQQKVILLIRRDTKSQFCRSVSVL